MAKKYYFLLFISFIGISLIKPGQLKQILRVDLMINKSEIYPGNLVELELITRLKDSSEIFSSESSTTINFADYVIELKKGATIYEKSRTKMILLISDTAYQNPELEFTVHLRRKSSIKAELKLPILYNVTQQVYFAGQDGYDPRANSDNGYRKIPLTSRVNIEFIDNEQTLTNNSDPNIIGENGPDLEVYVSLLKLQNGNQFLKVLVKKEFGGEYEKFIKVGGGALEIFSVGGKGGISKYGGKGGDGGNVTVYLTKEAKPFFNQIFIINHGGDGGDLWRPKVDGQQQGPFGNDGKIEIVDWKQ